MSIEASFAHARMVRGFSSKVLDGMDNDQLLAIPDGFNNNILWNIGHVLFYHCVFVYPRYGLDAPVPDSYKDLFKAGGSPKDWSETPDATEVIEKFNTICDVFDADLAAGKFEKFEPMELGNGVRLESIEAVLHFHGFHEGSHAGAMAAIKRFL